MNDQDRAAPIVILIDDDLIRLEAVAEATRRHVAWAHLGMLGADGDVAATSALREIYGRKDERIPDLVLVRADPRSWTAAAVLAIHRTSRPRQPVSAVVVAEGLSITLPVLITDFPGLCQLSPTDDVPNLIVSRLRAGMDSSSRPPAGRSCVGAATPIAGTAAADGPPWPAVTR